MNGWKNYSHGKYIWIKDYFGQEKEPRTNAVEKSNVILQYFVRFTDCRKRITTESPSRIGNEMCRW